MSFFGDIAVAWTTCTFCLSQPGERCVTESGKPAPVHMARWNPVAQIWSAGYDEAVADTQRDPEGWMRYCDVWVPSDE